MDILGEIDNYESMFFNRSWHGIGGIELRINRHMKYADTLLKNNLILIGTDLNKVFIIKHREIELDENGKITENWLIKGYALKSIVAQRITMPPVHTAYDNKSGPTESVMKHYVNNNLVNPVDPRRKIPQLVIAPDLQRGIHIDYSSRFKNVAEEMSTLSLTSGLGWDVTLDITNKQWVFDIVEGRNLVAGQSINPPVIFSPQFESLKSLQYTQSELNYKNVAIVAGQGEGVDRRVIEIGNYAAINRHEVFIDARDIAEVDEEEQPIPVPQIVQALTDRGQQQLNELIQEEYLEGQVAIGRREIKKFERFGGALPDMKLEPIDLNVNRNMFSFSLSPSNFMNFLTNTGVNKESSELEKYKRYRVKSYGGTAVPKLYRTMASISVGVPMAVEFELENLSSTRMNVWVSNSSPSLFIYVEPQEKKTIKIVTTPSTSTPQLQLRTNVASSDIDIIMSPIYVRQENVDVVIPWQPSPDLPVAERIENWYSGTIEDTSKISVQNLGEYYSSDMSYQQESEEDYTETLVEISTDNGTTWNPIENGSPLLQDSTAIPKEILIRRTIASTGWTSSPSITDLSYSIVGYTKSYEINTIGPLLGSDYDMGDIVTVQNKEWGVSMNARVTEIKEIYEESGFSIEATFGNNRPTLIQKIKQELSQISGEVRR